MIRIPSWLKANAVVWRLESDGLNGESHRVFSANDLVWMLT